MTPDQLEIAGSIFFNTSFLPASWDKKFAKSMAEIARLKPSKQLSEAQNECLYQLLHKYRNQNQSLYNKYKSNPLCAPKPKKQKA